MEELSLHILDIAENSIRADAKLIEIVIVKERGLLRIEIIDDGQGMDAETLARVRDPFFTTKHKKTGLGIPLLAQAAEMTGGDLVVRSASGRGTRITATFGSGHLDRPPMGDMAGTILTLIAGHPDRDYIYEEREGGRSFRIDTREIKQDLDGVPISDPGVLSAIRGLLKEHIQITE